MKRMFLAAAAALALMAILPAQAQFNGPYIGVHAGGAVVDTKTAIAGIDDGGAVTTGLAGTQLGYNRKLTDWSFMGIEVSGDLYRMHDGSPALIGTSGLTLDKGVAVVGRLGYLFAPKAAMYVGGGYGWTWVKDLNAGPGLSLSMPRGQAPIAIAGVEWKFADRWSLDARYRVDFNVPDNIDVSPGVPLHIDQTAHSLRVGLNFAFDQEPAAAAHGKAPPLK